MKINDTKLSLSERGAARYNAGRKKLDETGKIISLLRSARRKKDVSVERELRRVAKAARAAAKLIENANKKTKAATARNNRELDVARANNLKAAALPANAYQVLRTDEFGTRHVKVDEKTTLQVRAGKDVADAVSRHLNRRQITF